MKVSLSGKKRSTSAQGRAQVSATSDFSPARMSKEVLAFLSKLHDESIELLGDVRFNKQLMRRCLRPLIREIAHRAIGWAIGCTG
jgi:hypothetical protein